MDRPRTSRLRAALHVLLAVVGVGGVALIVVRAGPRQLASVVGAVARVFPLVVALEGARILASAWLTRLLLGEVARRIPRWASVRAEIEVVPVALFFPAGRAASESIKAVFFARYGGGAAAAAAATGSQALALLSGFVVSIPCLIAAEMAWGWSWLTLAIAFQASTAIGLGLFIQLAGRSRAVASLLARVSPRAGALAATYREALAGTPVVPLAPLGAALISRAAQLAQVGALAVFAGAPLRVAPLAFGVELVGAAAGDLVPAQVGATDSAFAFAAPSLGLAVANAVAIPLGLHAAQLVWAAASGIVAILPASSYGAAAGAPNGG